MGKDRSQFTVRVAIRHPNGPVTEAGASGLDAASADDVADTILCAVRAAKVADLYDAFAHDPLVLAALLVVAAKPGSRYEYSDAPGDAPAVAAAADLLKAADAFLVAYNNT